MDQQISRESRGNAMNEEKFMLMFSLGPVQTFIVQARKTRDLWLGSYLLSLLMEASMKGIESQLVYPQRPEIKDNIADLPNKYVAIFDTAEEARNAALKSKKQIESIWQTLHQDVWYKIIAQNAYWTQDTQDIWSRQTNPANCFEIFWVLVKGNPQHYARWLQETQQALDARKRLRNFQPANEPHEKSTISGEREALRGSGTWRSDVRSFWYELTSRQLSDKDTYKELSNKDISLDGTERLDAIDTVKRFAIHSPLLRKRGFRADFPSTSSMATAPFVAQLLRHQAQIDTSVLQAWLNATGGKLASSTPVALPYLKNLAGNDGSKIEILKRDGDCFFPEIFTAQMLKKNYGLPLPPHEPDSQQTTQRAETCRKATRDLLKATDALSIPRPTPYYTVLQMDGDRMGKIMGEVANQQEHKDISTALSTYSRDIIPPIVQNERSARLIYAGGDDVLALAPLEGLLDLADALQAEYCKQVQGAVKGDKRKADVTASMGIAIAHHFTPLSLVMQEVRAAEKLAKDRYGRNALVVTVLRRSGEHTRVGCHWQYGTLDATSPAQPLPLFKRFYQLFNDDILSPKCVYTLLEEAAILIKLTAEAQRSEIKRVLLRQRNSQKADELSDAAIKQLALDITDLSTAMDNAMMAEMGINSQTNTEQKPDQRATELHADKPRHGLVETLGWLLVMSFLTRKGQANENLY